jgi:hypothetical protein
MLECLREHEHGSEEERDACDAETHDAISLIKMSQVGFASPAKVGRNYFPGRLDLRGSLEVVVFAEEQVVPWEFETEEEEEVPETD